jgi:hypothetical protein
MDLRAMCSEPFTGRDSVHVFDCDGAGVSAIAAAVYRAISAVVGVADHSAKPVPSGPVDESDDHVECWLYDGDVHRPEA